MIDKLVIQDGPKKDLRNHIVTGRDYTNNFFPMIFKTSMKMQLW